MFDIFSLRLVEKLALQVQINYQGVGNRNIVGNLVLIFFTFNIRREPKVVKMPSGVEVVSLLVNLPSDTKNIQSTFNLVLF